MLDLKMHTVDNAPQECRAVLRGVQSDVGFVPNMAATIAASPALLTGFDGLRRGAALTRLTPAHREIVGLATGLVIGNAYGVAFHTATLDRLGVPEDDWQAIRTGQLPSDPKAAALVVTSQRVVRGHGRLSAEELDEFLDAGFDPSDLLEVVAEVIFACLVGFVDNLVDRVPLDGPLENYALA